MKTERRLTARIALALGVLLFVLWSILGTGVSLAWFTDETQVVKNVFNFATFDFEVSYKNDTVTDYAPVEIDTNIFGDEALYEPGYTQVVYLKVKNISGISMNYRLSADIRSVTVGRSIFGSDIYLPNYLRYGVVFGDAEADLTRESARETAENEMEELTLNSYSEWDSVTLSPGEERYVTLIVYMPEHVDNFANYRGDAVPSVEMGLTVYAEQAAD